MKTIILTTVVIVAMIILTPTLVHAANEPTFPVKAEPGNEGSHKYGLGGGFFDYKCTTNTDSAGSCDQPSKTDDIDNCKTGAKYGVTNQTACVDGYVDGWKAWCKTDAGICAFWASQHIYPSSMDKKTWIEWR